MTAQWDAVEAQAAAVSILRAALSRDELAHAWLVVGPEGVGQEQLVHALGAALNCPESQVADVGCGACSTCIRIDRGAHPAVQSFVPEGQFHLVSAVREEWIPTATRTLTEGRRKVLRIEAADRMNEAAQNAFLKMLEEPPPSVVWILEAQDLSPLLDTIVSRCRRIDVVPWGPGPLMRHAERKGIEEQHRDALVRAAMGSPARLEDLADPDVAEARRRHLGLVGRLAEEGPGRIVPIAKELVAWSKQRMEPVKAANEVRMSELEEAFGVDNPRDWPKGVKQRLEKRFKRLERQEQRRALETVLDDLASYLRDVLVVAGGGDADQVINVDHIDELRRDAQVLSVAACFEGLEAIGGCREALERNGQPELQLERLLLVLALPLYRATA